MFLPGISCRGNGPGGMLGFWIEALVPPLSTITVRVADPEMEEQNNQPFEMVVGLFPRPMDCGNPSDSLACESGMGQAEASWNNTSSSSTLISAHILYDLSIAERGFGFPLVSIRCEASPTPTLSPSATPAPSATADSPASGVLIRAENIVVIEGTSHEAPGALWRFDLNLTANSLPLGGFEFRLVYNHLLLSIESAEAAPGGAMEGVALARDRSFLFGWTSIGPVAPAQALARVTVRNSAAPCPGAIALMDYAAGAGLVDEDGEEIPHQFDDSALGGFPALAHPFACAWTPDPTPANAWELGLDSDSDGFADWLEQARGTNPADPQSRPLLGDVDGDGRVTVRDAALLMRWTLPIYPPVSLQALSRLPAFPPLATPVAPVAPVAPVPRPSLRPQSFAQSRELLADQPPEASFISPLSASLATAQSGPALRDLDINHDGQITTRDALALYRWAVQASGYSKLPHFDSRIPASPTYITPVDATPTYATPTIATPTISPASPSPTPAPSSSPESSPSPSPSLESSPTPSPSESPSPSPSISPTPSDSSQASPTNTASPSTSGSPIFSPTETNPRWPTLTQLPTDPPAASPTIPPTPSPLPPRSATPTPESAFALDGAFIVCAPVLDPLPSPYATIYATSSPTPTVTDTSLPSPSASLPPTETPLPSLIPSRTLHPTPTPTFEIELRVESNYLPIDDAQDVNGSGLPNDDDLRCADLHFTCWTTRTVYWKIFQQKMEHDNCPPPPQVLEIWQLSENGYYTLVNDLPQQADFVPAQSKEYHFLLKGVDRISSKIVWPCDELARLKSHEFIPPIQPLIHVVYSDTLEALLDPNCDSTTQPNPCFERFRYLFTINNLDIDIDSGNMRSLTLNLQQDPERSLEEDRIESFHTEQSTGKVILANQGDSDSDGVPDFADGINLFDNPSIGEHPSASFAPIIIQLPADSMKYGDFGYQSGGTRCEDAYITDGYDVECATVRFDYFFSDPYEISVELDADNRLAFVPPLNGRLRIWTKDGTSMRNACPIDFGGDLIEPGVDYPLMLLDSLPAENHISSAPFTYRFFVEGVKHSDSLADSIVRVSLDPLGFVDESGNSLSDEVRITIAPLVFDLDIDSDNTDGLADPERTDFEDAIEDYKSDDILVSLPYKIIPVSNLDADTDGIPDFADGFNWGSETQAGENAAFHFTPILLEWKGAGDIDESKAIFRFEYFDSNPAAIAKNEVPSGSGIFQYEAAPGALRLWTRDGVYSRNSHSVTGSSGGNYVPSGSDIPASRLASAKIPGTNSIWRLYVEGIDKSATPGDRRIVVKAYVNIDSEVHGPVAQDAVRLTIKGLDLDIDSDNSNGVGQPDQNEQEDALEDAPNALGKVVPVNQNDDDNDGIPDFADGYDLHSYGAQNLEYLSTPGERSMIPLILNLGGLMAEEEEIRIRFDYAEAPPDAVTRSQGESFPYASYPDIWVSRQETQSASPPTLYSYNPGVPLDSAKLRIWRVSSPGAPRTIGDNYIAPYVRARGGDANRFYTLAELGLQRPFAPLTLYVEGIAGGPAEVVVSLVSAGDPENVIAQDRVKLYILDANINMNSDNDYSHRIDQTDDAIEDQSPAGRFWRADAYADNVSNPDGNPGQKVIDYFPMRFTANADMTFATGLQYYWRIWGPDGAAVEVYPYPGAADAASLMDHITNAEAGESTAAADRLMLHKGKMLPLNLAPSEALKAARLLRFMSKGEYKIQLYAAIANPRLNDPLESDFIPCDSIRLNALDPMDYVWFGSMRPISYQIPPVIPFDNYPLDFQDDGTLRQIQTTYFLSVFQDAEDNIDSSWQKHLVFLHGYNVPNEASKTWAAEMRKRLYWTGWRGNFLAVSWPGNQGNVAGDLTFYDPNVYNALHCSPSLYDFLLNLTDTGGIDPENLYVMAHSLGNLVMWDALRIYQHCFPGTKLVKAAISIEPAIWPEAFDPMTDEAYNHVDAQGSADEDWITYSVDSLARHSWKYWFRQMNPATGQTYYANQSAENVYHNYVPDDDALWWMRFNDNLNRSAAYLHYDRSSLIYSSYRDPEKLSDIPTLMIHGRRHYTYGLSDLNLPIGTMESTAVTGFGTNNNPLAAEQGWEARKHSDLKDKPIFSIFSWYYDWLSPALDIENE